MSFARRVTSYTSVTFDRLTLLLLVTLLLYPTSPSPRNMSGFFPRRSSAPSAVLEMTANISYYVALSSFTA